MENPESRVFHGPRQMEVDEFRQTSKLVDSEPMEIRLEFTIGDNEAGLTEAEVEEIFRNYATFKTDYRAVLLLDIVGFSKHTPEA
ncbi:MAG: hypothetical protein MKZ89_10055, partial [Nisaea sp.]|nr:hypothetical protein [Nisaea sp.]